MAATGTRVRVLEHGEGPPVLFLHGGPNAASTWAPIVGRLPGIRALALDRPGCGLSESLPSAGDEGRIWDAMVEVQVAAIEALGGGPVDVVGSSFGGGCALSLAASRPDLVRRLVIEGVPTVEGMRIASNMRILAAGPVGRFIARRPATRAVLRRTFRQLGHRRLVDSGWPSGADLAWGLSMMNDTPTMQNEVALIQSAATWRGFRAGRLAPADILDRIAAPTLWLWGDADPFGSRETGRAWARRMPTATLEVLEASGHLPWLDDPAAHAERIGRFLRRQLESAGAHPLAPTNLAQLQSGLAGHLPLPSRGPTTPLTTTSSPWPRSSKRCWWRATSTSRRWRRHRV